VVTSPCDLITANLHNQQWVITRGSIATPCCGRMTSAGCQTPTQPRSRSPVSLSPASLPVLLRRMIYLLPIKIELDGDKETLKRKPPLSLCLRLKFTPSLPTPPGPPTPPERCSSDGWGKWGLQSGHHCSSPPLLPPHAFHSLQHGAWLQAFGVTLLQRGSAPRAAGESLLQAGAPPPRLLVWPCCSHSSPSLLTAM